MDLIYQVFSLFILAVPVACISWTITHEEAFHEVKDFCISKSKDSKNLFKRKFFYLLTCEYCLSHYVTILMLIMTKFTLLMPGWRGYIISGFSVVWIANIYMSLYSFLRVDIKKEKEETTLAEKENQKKMEKENYKKISSNGGWVNLVDLSIKSASRLPSA